MRVSEACSAPPWTPWCNCRIQEALCRNQPQVTPGNQSASQHQRATKCPRPCHAETDVVTAAGYRVRRSTWPTSPPRPTQSTPRSRRSNSPRRHVARAPLLRRRSSCTNVLCGRASSRPMCLPALNGSHVAGKIRPSTPFDEFKVWGSKSGRRRGITRARHGQVRRIAARWTSSRRAAVASKFAFGAGLSHGMRTAVWRAYYVEPERAPRLLFPSD